MTPNFDDLTKTYLDQPVKNIQQYYERLAWFLSRSSIFLRDKTKNQIVMLKDLSPGSLKVLVQADGLTSAYYVHIDDVEPVMK